MLLPKNINPIVTVLLSVYNGEKYLSQAIQSILDQSYQNFEFLIIDDHSTDTTPDILSKFHDCRIRIICNPENYGLAKSLNIGLNLAKGSLIARCDADDFFEPDRLEKQITFFDEHPDIDVIGTGCKIIRGDGKVVSSYFPPSSHNLIQWHLIFMNPLIHPSVIFRKNKILKIGGYDEKFIAGQDYELWTRGYYSLKYANIPEPLTYLRKHDSNTSLSKSGIQLENWYISSSNLISQLIRKKIDFNIGKDIVNPTIPLMKDRTNEVVSILLKVFAVYIKEHKLLFEEEQIIIDDLSHRISQLNERKKRNFFPIQHFIRRCLENNK